MSQRDEILAKQEKAEKTWAKALQKAKHEAITACENLCTLCNYCSAEGPFETECTPSCQFWKFRPWEDDSPVVGDFGIWKPWETAPKDGSLILAYWDNGLIKIVYWYKTECEWKQCEAVRGIDHLLPPCHWAPLNLPDTKLEPNNEYNSKMPKAM